MNRITLQIEKIADESKGKRVDVIVQVRSQRSPDEDLRLARAATQALTRRRLSLNPRDLLPGTFKEDRGPKARSDSASMRAQLGAVTNEALALAEIRKLGQSSLSSLNRSSPWQNGAIDTLQTS